MTPQPLLKDTLYFDHMCQVKCITKFMTSSPLWGAPVLCVLCVLCPVSFAPFASYAPLLRGFATAAADFYLQQKHTPVTHTQKLFICCGCG